MIERAVWTVVFTFLVIVVVFTGSVFWRLHTPECEQPPRPAALSLPQQCALYYNDGTGRWRDCMNVGLK